MPELWEGVLAEGREMDHYRVSKEIAGDMPVNGCGLNSGIYSTQSASSKLSVCLDKQGPEGSEPKGSAGFCKKLLQFKCFKGTACRLHSQHNLPGQGRARLSQDSSPPQVGSPSCQQPF